MNFETYLKEAWKNHGTQPETVAQGFSGASVLLETNDQLAQLAGLMTHVMGEHLGQWREGVRLLESLQKHPSLISESETDKTILRSLAALQIGGGESPNLSSFSTSDQIRIMAIASSALSGRNSSRAQELLSKALDLAQLGLDKNDPAYRALAITGNNLACALEEKNDRSDEDVKLMVLAAQTSRKFWQVAGTWLEVSRAEYRLAMTFIQAKDLERAFQHAQSCVEMCHENAAGDLDLFFGYEALALVERAKKNELGFNKAVQLAKSFFEKLSPEDKSWCEKSLNNLL